MASDSFFNLVSLGILKQVTIPKELEWLSDIQHHLLTTLYLVGDGGLTKGMVLKLLKKDETHLIKLDMSNYIKWEHDNKGRKSILTLTWQGEEVAKKLYEIAKNQSH